MHSLEFVELNKRLWIPENLGECKRDQFLDMSKLIYLFHNSEITYHKFRVMGLYILMNMSFSQEEFEAAEDEKWQNIYIASELLDTFFTVDEAGVKHLVLDFIHNPVKSFKYKGLTYKSVRDNFEGIKYGQFEDGFGEYENFKKTGEIEYLVRLFAIFHLRPNESFGNLNLEKRCKWFDMLDIRHVYGFYLLFVSFVNYITKDCAILLDGKEIEISMLFQSESGGEEAQADQPVESIGLRSTSFQLAESGVFGPYDKVRSEDYLIILIRMCDLVFRNRREKREMEEAKNQSENKNND